MYYMIQLSVDNRELSLGIGDNYEKDMEIV